MGKGVGGGEGDLPDITAEGPEVPQQQVDGEVPQLAGKEASQAGEDLDVAGGGVQGVVDVVGYVAGKPPVVPTVLEQIGDRHGGIGEPVDEHGLQDSEVLQQFGQGDQGLVSSLEISRSMMMGHCVEVNQAIFSLVVWCYRSNWVMLHISLQIDHFS